MKKFRLLLAIALASVCSIQMGWARIAPSLPVAQTLESGKTYYLYNVLENKFACQSSTNTSYVGLGTYGEKVLITATANENEYIIQWASSKYYWRADASSVGSYNSSNNLVYFIIAESSKGYSIQRSPKNVSYYKSDEYVGFNGSNGDRLSPVLAEGSIHWVLFTVEDAEYYMAKHKLYTYLEVADQYNFYITQYDQVYENLASTTAELDYAQATLKNALDMSQNYVSPNWTEYPILFQNNTDNKWELDSDKKSLYWKLYKSGTSALESTSTLTGTVNVDNDATLCYTYSGNDYTTMRIYLDGELVEIIKANTAASNRRYYIELTPGKHDITWTCLYSNATIGSSSYYTYSYLKNIGIMDTPTIQPATTTVEGQLGTEVLKLVDPVSSVKKIVISGVIGAEDWTTIGLMVNALSIDMSGATATAPMPASMFTKSKFSFLHNVELPQGLTSIGSDAFSGSDVENEMTFPESLKTIGSSAFYNSKLKAAYMSEGITSIGSSAFSSCKFLENATYPSSVGTIPDNCFNECWNLRTFAIPEGITSIGRHAFYNCWQFNPRFPSTMEQIKYEAFYNTATESLFVTEKMTVNSSAFSNCQNLVYAEWPTCFYEATHGGYEYGTNGVVKSCPKLNKVKLMSPTVVAYDSQSFFYGNTLSNITLLVPDYLVSAYKLDPYWYKCKVEGFSSVDITDWYVKKPLVLNAGQRIGGTPSLHFSGSDASFVVNGDETQSIKDLSINYCPKSFSSSNYTRAIEWGMMLGNTSHVNITGELSENVLTAAKTWYFLTLPFDTKVGDITAKALDTNVATSYAIRYYDGAARANNGTGGNWKNYSKDDIIPAGTGFIYQTAKAASSKFVAQDNATKQYILSNNEFVKALAANPSEVTANKGWNLVGNPWQTYYNIHKLNFTAPITVWNLNGNYGYGNYEAYSIIDDDYAIKPLEAIFVQCPDEVNSISFPIDGRQLTSVIESQNGVKAFAPQEQNRWLIDVQLSDGELSDKTRFVLNEQASLNYEVTCDASKFFSMDNAVPQIYTIEESNQLAINERPMDDGIVKLGLKVAANGSYIISAPRNQFREIILFDLETGTETNLCAGSYTFTADAGTTEGRFELRLNNNSIVTSIDEAKAEEFGKTHAVYTLDGRQMTSPMRKGIYVVDGKKVIVK